MGTTLSNGVYLPDEGERNCYAGLKVNWEILNQKVADIVALQLAIAGALHREIVESLPTTDIDPHTIYMILNGTSATENVYNEFMYVNNAWELIGTSATDLTNYYTKAEVDGKLLLKANASDLTSHTGDTTIHVTANDKTKWNNSANTHVLRLALSALTPSTSNNSFSNLDDSTALKVGDKVMDTAGVLFEVTAIDTQNSTFTIGTALIDLAQDSDVVHKSGNETVSGEKNFGGMLTFRGSYLGSEPSTSFRTCLELLGRFDTKDKSGFYFSKFRSNSTQGELSGSDAAFCTLDVLENGVRTNGILRFNLSAWSGSTPGTFSLYPKSGMNTNLGTTANKWTKFNGVEPSALGMPNLSNGIDISSYITAGNTHNEYTPLVNGWISVILKSTSGDLALFVYQGGMVNAQFGKTSLPNETEPCVMVSIPVNGGIVVNIDTKGSNSYVYSAKFFPCQGNV